MRQQDWSRLAPVPASTGPILLQPHPGDCIDDYQSKLADDNKIDIFGCNGTGAQNWSIQSDGTIHNGTSGYCIGVSGGGVSNGTVLILYTCDSHTSQEWIPQSSGSLRNLNSATCLDDPSDSTTNGTQLQIWTCNGNPQQNWTLP